MRQNIPKDATIESLWLEFAETVLPEQLLRDPERPQYRDMRAAFYAGYGCMMGLVWSLAHQPTGIDEAPRIFQERDEEMNRFALKMTLGMEEDQQQN